MLKAPVGVEKAEYCAAKYDLSAKINGLRP